MITKQDSTGMPDRSGFTLREDGIKVRILVGICSSRSYDARRAAVRETWLGEHTPGITSVFFVGEGDPQIEDEPDMIVLPVDDGYDRLPEKVLAFFKYALKHYDFEWLFKCDDDTYLATDRLESLADTAFGIVGDPMLANRGAPSGGAGYLLRREIVEKIVVAKNIPRTGAEDVIFGELAVRSGAVAHSTKRLCHDVSRRPHSTNDIVTAHWCTPAKLREIHHFYRAHPIRTYAGAHPSWRDSVHFYENGLFIRHESGCAGIWRCDENRNLILRWFQWGEERVSRVDTGYANNKGFSLAASADGEKGLENIILTQSAYRNMLKPIKAYGGIGNCVNAACAAQISGRPLQWAPQGALRLEDIFENPEILEIVPDEGEMVWLYPNIQAKLLGMEEHHPNHESISPEELNEKHWKGPVVKGDGRLKLKIKSGGMRVPNNTAGVHLRTMHPRITCDIAAAVKAVNKMSETHPVYVASDAALPGLSQQVMTGRGIRMRHDLDRGREAMLASLYDWHTLGNCSVIHRNSSLSTFADYWCFGAGKPMKRLII